MRIAVTVYIETEKMLNDVVCPNCGRRAIIGPSYLLAI
jgi:predicted RNA-binding Zn-ribbon protein involved in translation (DUF1610 family)